MKRGEAFPSNFIGKEDVTTPLRVIIGPVHREEIQSDNGKEFKNVMEVKGHPKKLILNNINWDTLENAYGEDSDDWIGKEMELYVDPSVMFGGKRVGGVRVRIPTAPAGNGELWNLERALKECEAVQIDKHDLKSALTARGHEGYNAARDTALVKRMVEEARTRLNIPAISTEDVFQVDDIPF